jgi:hypothetical protein
MDALRTYARNTLKKDLQTVVMAAVEAASTFKLSRA